MPDMTPELFNATDWAAVSADDWERYAKGQEVNGVSLTPMQRMQAQKRRPNKATFTKVVVSNDFSAADLQGDDLGAAPFANQAIPVSEFGVRWWFQYFWQEAKMSAGQQDRVDMAAICNRIFVKTPGGLRKFVLKPAYKDDDLNSGTPNDWREMMTTLLRIGFRKVDQLQAVQSGPSTPPVVDRAAHHTMLQADFAPYIPKKYTPQTEIFWRSEARTIDRIIQQKGTTRQSDVKAIADEMNMVAPWHPFSDGDIRKYMWFRLGQKDNDYYTVISVATNFETALGFPKIDERRVYGFPARALSEWTRDEAQLHRANLALVSLKTGETRVMLATRVTTYMCVACGRIIDTQRAGGGFPEKGVSEIALDQIFAFLPATRIHHGPTNADGFTAFVDVDRAHLQTQDWAKAMDLFGDSYQRCSDEYFRQKYRGAVVTAWGSGGATQPRIDPSVSRILEFPISDATFRDFKAARATPATAVGHPPAHLDFIKDAGWNVQKTLKPVVKKPI